MENLYLDAVNLSITVVAGIAGWLAGRRKQKNDFLSELQSSIDLLSEKNRQLVEEVVQLRTENADIGSEVIQLREENKALRAEIKVLSKQLENVKTITKKIKQ